ncbi:DUF938 domain-containing protein [Marinobacter zhejiangensis]|uniref:Methylase n=1 Tax=Marinobacter zhejiangensis TaxID=488535 RepID=A0A1I4L317_9GAMM|nr:DUF938 domain-containing protein [Marinobacter zhejiangensis]SFL85412.1 Protein of unknown function [Marinobacter zhejiangensis]
MVEKPFSQACENNKRPILEQLQRFLPSHGLVLEIGTGTGQHAIYFATALPALHWQPSDQPDVVGYCQPWLAEFTGTNLLAPLSLNVAASPWPLAHADAVFSANTSHIMSWPEVEAMFAGVANLLPAHGVFCLYGPFNYQGRYTSDSNRAFDEHLKAQKSTMGLRDMDDLSALGAQVGLELEDDVEMPANNRFLVWRRHR